MQEEQDPAKEPLSFSLAKMQRIRPDLDIALRDPATGQSVYVGATTPEVIKSMQAQMSQMLHPALEAKLHAKQPENELLRDLMERDEAINRVLYKCYLRGMKHKQILELLKDANSEWYAELRQISYVAMRKRADKYQERHRLPLLPKQPRMK